MESRSSPNVLTLALHFFFFFQVEVEVEVEEISQGKAVFNKQYSVQCTSIQIRRPWQQGHH